jgi:hypothetical protein
MSLDDALNHLVQKSRNQKARSQSKIEQKRREIDPNAEQIKRHLAG